TWVNRDDRWSEMLLEMSGGVGLPKDIRDPSTPFRQGIEVLLSLTAANDQVADFKQRKLVADRRLGLLSEGAQFSDTALALCKRHEDGQTDRVADELEECGRVRDPKREASRVPDPVSRLGLDVNRFGVGPGPVVRRL